ncbi:hypothetical protein ACFWXH_26350 [Mesorhizobium sp. NPDC059054]|uniref:hypothetical protein n=1 Tax=Mesorhizobium sp. NPDC059054 TaxID=3346711 RepID=UPI0036763946
MFQNDQMFTGEIGLVVLTLVPIFAAALVGLAIFMRRENTKAILRTGAFNRRDNE